MEARRSGARSCRRRVWRSNAAGIARVRRHLAAFGPAMEPNPKSSQIKYVIIIVQENRTPDNLFQGLKGADIATSGLNSFGQTVSCMRFRWKSTTT